MKRLAPGCFHLPLGYSNAYLLEARETLSLVDAGVKGSDKSVAKHLREAGFALADIAVILITHAHPDHVGSLPELLGASDAEVWVHALDAPVLRGDAPLASTRPAPASLPPFDRFLARMGGGQPSAPVARELAEGERLDELYPGLSVVHLPGHSPGQIGFWSENERLLIGGDVMMHLPWGLTMPIRAFTHDWDEAKRSLRKVAGLKVDKLALGHGGPLERTAAKVEKLAARVR